VIGVDATGQNVLVNREEFYPYGETSYGGFGRKRYRFTGKERDEESGLSYHGARYYASWLVRWTSCDPAGGNNRYTYARQNPTAFVDTTGLVDEKPDASTATPELCEAHGCWRSDDRGQMEKDNHQMEYANYLNGIQSGSSTKDYKFTDYLQSLHPGRGIPDNQGLITSLTYGGALIAGAEDPVAVSNNVKPLQAAAYSVNANLLGSMARRPDANRGINPRLVDRLTSWRSYVASGGTMTLRDWVSATQRQYSGVSGGYESGFAQWSKDQAQELFLYKMSDAMGFKKWGVTNDLSRREGEYRSSPYYMDRKTGQGNFLFSPKLEQIDRGPRRTILATENLLYCSDPGPANNEQGAGKKY
jgi:RHS repeat-associated protein